MIRVTRTTGEQAGHQREQPSQRTHLAAHANMTPHSAAAFHSEKTNGTFVSRVALEEVVENGGAERVFVVGQSAGFFDRLPWVVGLDSA